MKGTKTFQSYYGTVSNFSFREWTPKFDKKPRVFSYGTVFKLFSPWLLQTNYDHVLSVWIKF